MSCMLKLVAALALSAAFIVGGMFAGMTLQDQQTSHDPHSRQDVPPEHAQEGGGFPDLVAGLKATPGCLGVESAHTESGKEVLFAWFEDKKAALRWYYSDMHTQVMQQFFPHEAEEHDELDHDPMANVPDDVPILIIASVTFADRPHFEGTTNLPISQIAIEMYTPVSGGVYLGGRFAPKGLKVEGLENAAEEYEHIDD